MKVVQYEVLERDGVIWLKWGDGKYPIPNYFNGLDQFRGVWVKVRSEAGFGINLENQLDSTHPEFVHAKSFFPMAKETLEQEMHLTLTNERIHFYFGDRSDFFWELMFPNVWSNPVGDDYVMTIVYAPVDDVTTDLYIGSHRKFQGFPGSLAQLPLADRLVDDYIGNLYRRITEEDQQVVRSQQRNINRSRGERKEWLIRNDDRTIRHVRSYLNGTWPFVQANHIVSFPAVLKQPVEKSQSDPTNTQKDSSAEAADLGTIHQSGLSHYEWHPED
jgi:phenylpropionate dioxygenase-like ring-hydroxylating dioxygenase large terminal subunit